MSRTRNSRRWRGRISKIIETSDDLRETPHSVTECYRLVQSEPEQKQSRTDPRSRVTLRFNCQCTFTSAAIICFSLNALSTKTVRFPQVSRFLLHACPFGSVSQVTTGNAALNGHIHLVTPGNAVKHLENTLTRFAIGTGDARDDVRSRNCSRERETFTTGRATRPIREFRSNYKVCWLTIGCIRSSRHKVEIAATRMLGTAPLLLDQSRKGRRDQSGTLCNLLYDGW